MATSAILSNHYFTLKYGTIRYFKRLLTTPVLRQCCEKTELVITHYLPQKPTDVKFHIYAPATLETARCARTWQWILCVNSHVRRWPVSSFEAHLYGRGASPSSGRTHSAGAVACLAQQARMTCESLQPRKPRLSGGSREKPPRARRQTDKQMDRLMPSRQWSK